MRFVVALCSASFLVAVAQANAPSTRYHMGPSGPIYGRQSLEPRRLRNNSQSIEALRGSRPVTGGLSNADRPSSSGSTEEGAP